MPRIRKKTSRRLSTHDRKRVQKNVKESKRRKAKAAKKSPQWKSKHKKDPGIPNEFPYKDQILAEIAEQRRVVAEEKQRHREEKYSGKQQGKLDTENDQGVESDTIVTLSAKELHKSKVEITSSTIGDREEADGEDVPILYNRDLRSLRSVLVEADAVICVLDAREPMASRSLHLETLVKERQGQRLLFLLNKIDLCPREAVESWLKVFRRDQSALPFRSASAFLPLPFDPSKPKARVTSSVNDALGAEVVKEHLKQWSTGSGEKLTVAVVGVPNAGKSAFINSLLGHPSLPIYTLTGNTSAPSTTILCQEVQLELGGLPIRIIDTPGLLWDAERGIDAASRSRDILLRSKGRMDKLKDTGPVVMSIVERASHEDLMVHYSLPAFAKGDHEALLVGLARSNGLVKKRGELDTAAAARILLRDWCTGKFPYYTIPATNSQTHDMIDETTSVQNATLLACLPTRKDKRKATGLIRLSSLDIDTRSLAVDTPWPGLCERIDSRSQQERIGDDRLGRSNGDEVSEDEGDEGDEEDEDEDEDEWLDGIKDLSLSRKRKRVASAAGSAPTKKKVAFADRILPSTKTMGSSISKKLGKSSINPASIAASQKSARKSVNTSKESKLSYDDDFGNSYDFGKFF